MTLMVGDRVLIRHGPSAGSWALVTHVRNSYWTAVLVALDDEVVEYSLPAPSLTRLD
jgi:hypothetical protein